MGSWKRIGVTPAQVDSAIDAKIEALDFGTAAFLDAGTDPAEVPQNSDLGSAAYLDAGTDPAEVPQNSDLGSAAYLDAGTAANNVVALDAETKFDAALQATEEKDGTMSAADKIAINYLRTTPILADPVIGIALVATGGGAGTWQRVDEDGNNIVGDAFSFGGVYYQHHPCYGAGIGAEVIDGQAMIRIPKVYVKTGDAPGGSDQAGKRCYWISPEAKSGFHLHPAFYDAGDPIDQFWWGAYKATLDSGKLRSVNVAATPLVSTPMRGTNSFDTYAAARNTGGVTGFMQISIYQLAIIQRLMLIELGSPDAQTLIHAGHTSGSAAINVNHATELAASWRGINGLWGNVTQFCEGLQQKSGTAEIQLWDRTGGKTWIDTGAAGNTTGSWRYPVTLSVASGTGYDFSDLFWPASYDATYGNGTLADGHYGGTTADTRVLRSGGHYTNGAFAGPFFSILDDAPSDPGTSGGGRLAKV